MPKNKSTQETKKENYQNFLAWTKSMSDEDYRQIVTHRGTLSRDEISKQCGFGRSSINSNPEIQDDLSVLEKQLRTRNVLPKKADSKTTDDDLPVRDTQKSKNMMNSKKLTRLEQEVTALRAENQKFREALAAYELLEEVLNESGRMPVATNT